MLVHHKQQQQQPQEQEPGGISHAANGGASGDDAEGMNSNRAKRFAAAIINCVGDSRGSDSGKVLGKIVQKGVDLEISGGNRFNEETSSQAHFIAASTRFRSKDAVEASNVRQCLLEDRKHGTTHNLPHQQKVNYSHNLQYLEIVSPPDEQITLPQAGPIGQNLPVVQSHLDLATEVANRQRKQRRQELYAQLKKQVCRDRIQAVRRMSQNAVYVNDNFERPWQTVSRISDQLVEELMLETAEQGLDFGEESFVEEFLRLQLDG
ncbi:uncharacterized protein LOC131684236 [Topomyia yanbarensis]|uniref:uncharacterized protein LOC131684236 n=1 Tax=Topomyia yanbarensis TaxID=2498891 RepID=UPI00273BD329|nr:uncharacterized protein LOC131684236 [Topomyia yanbarensis]